MLLRRDRAMNAISVMLDVAFHGTGTVTVSATDIADRMGAARRGLEPLLQALSRAGLLESVRGPRGGYRLGRPRREITLADIVDACGAPPDEDQADATPLHQAVMVPLWAELDQSAQTSLTALTLDDLIRRAARAGLRRPESEPITYAI